MHSHIKVLGLTLEGNALVDGAASFIGQTTARSIRFWDVLIYNSNLGMRRCDRPHQVAKILWELFCSLALLG